MVVALGPGRFYGSSLPRPRFFPDDRVDPPAPVTDPLLAWAREAHWSMGGLSSKRLRFQGRIEGSIVKLRRRVRRDARAAAKAPAAGQKPASLAALGSDDDGTNSDEEVEVQERILKRQVVDEEPESEEDNDEEALATIAAAAKRKRARKLGDEYDHIAELQHEGEAKKQKPPAASPATTSPRGKTAAVASTPAAGTPAGTSPRSKAAAAAAASTPVAGARRTSSRNKHSLRCSLHVQF